MARDASTPARPDAMRVDHASLGRHRIRYAVRRGDPSRPPLLILNGIGANIELAQPFIAALTGPTIVIFDAPGVGASPTPAAPYRVSTIARLAVALLDHLGIERVDVLGVSWGGAVAQQFALQHGSRCRRLVLAATAPGSVMVPARPSVLVKMATPRRYVDKAHALRVAGDIYGGVFRRDRELIERTFRHVRFADRRGYYLQLAAVFGWTSLPWLFLLRQPTLILAGEDDPLVPALNARIMHWLIPDARLEKLPCGHLFLVTLPAQSAAIVDEFLTGTAETRTPSAVPSPASRRSR